jgi:predicted nucleotidyltransferase
MIENIIDGMMLEALAALQPVFEQFNIDFYLVGAVARDIHLSANPALAPKRRTKDVDIAVMVADEGQFYAIKEALLQTGVFTALETEAIKLFYKQAIEIDLMPFGEIENENREIRIHKPKLFVMDVPGFKEVFPSAEEIEISNGSRLKVSSLEGLVLLKLIAYDDNPTRVKDLSDIDHIITVYFDLYDNLVYEDYMDVMNEYETDHPAYLQLISARVIGRKINSLLINEPYLLKRTIRISRKRMLETWQALVDGMEDEVNK